MPESLDVAAGFYRDLRFAETSWNDDDMLIMEFRSEKARALLRRDGGFV
jgi:hypothetical protein